METLKRATELLAAHKLGKHVDYQEVCEICMDLNDFKGNAPLKRRMRELRDSLMFASPHLKGLW